MTITPEYTRTTDPLFSLCTAVCFFCHVSRISVLIHKRVIGLGGQFSELYASLAAFLVFVMLRYYIVLFLDK